VLMRGRRPPPTPPLHIRAGGTTGAHSPPRPGHPSCDTRTTPTPDAPAPPLPQRRFSIRVLTFNFTCVNGKQLPTRGAHVENL